jgi:hypothetical protein
MGRQQFYKGNPELKQYFLVNDFSGGINTTDVDERTTDNEFRELLNVELIRAGMLQNRKGWGESALFNDLLDAKQVSLPRFDTQSATGEFANKYALIKVVKNEGNLLTVLDNYEENGLTLQSFNQLGLVYRLEILLVYETTNPVGVRVALLTLSNDTALDGIDVITDFAGVQFDASKLLSNIETVEYTDYLYFSLSQIKPTLKGLFEYDIVNQTHRIVRDDETDTAFIYKPTPYEVSKIGFNVLSTTPLTDIEEQVGFLSITGLFLTTYEVSLVNNASVLVDTQTPITNFPNDGKVTLNVLYTGIDVDLEDFTTEFYVMGTNLTTGLPEERPIDFTVDASKLEGTSGIARFACTVEVKNNTTIYIRVKLLSGIVFAEKVITQPTFVTTTAMVNYFNPTTNTKFAVSDGVNKFVLYNKTATPYQYDLQTGFSYNPGSGVQTFTPIYNDLNISNVNAWQEITSGGADAYAAASSRSDYKSQTFTEFTDMTAATVPTPPTGLVLGHVLRVQKSKYVQGTTKIVTMSSSTQTAYNATSLKREYRYGSVPFPQGCPTFFNPPSNTEFATLVFNIAENGQIWRLYYEAWILSTNLGTGSSSYVPYRCPNSLGYYQASVTEGTNNYYEDASPVEYKYYRIISPSAELITPIVTYNPTSKKLFYRTSDAAPVEITSAGTIDQINSITQRIPQRKNLYLAINTAPNEEASYYRYDGGTAGTLDDFETAVFVTAADTSIYTDIYVVGGNPNLKKIESLDLTGFRILEIGNRLVLYKNNIIWFSDLYQFDYIPNYNYIILPLTPDDFITGVTYFKGSYMIFTKERIYKMSGTFGGADFQVQLVNDAIGCISPFSIKAFNNTIVFMTHDGMYRIKQNYYQNGLENVEKIDKQIDNIIPNNVNTYAFLYNEQYILIYDYNENLRVADPGFNVLKLYYNMTAPNGFPYVKDRYSIMPKIVARLDNGLYSIANGRFYQYDKGYYDFLPPGETTELQKDLSKYTVRIRTHKISFGYPTHEKKFKSILIKDIANEPVPLLFDIYINNIRVYQHTQFEATLNDLNEIVYQPIVTKPLFIGSDNLLGNFELNKDQLGDLSARVHKIVFSGKGKDILIDIQRTTAQEFSIQDIGYVYKMGKAREDR